MSVGGVLEQIGASIGRYVVLEEIGRGGMGRVLRAYDPKLQREVALKEVRRETIGVSGARRLVAEARAMAKLSHPNVVAIYDVEEIEAGEVVLVMEYVAGETLTEWLRSPRAWRDVVAHLRRAGRGLAAAHAAGLLHRDFKPDNVLVSAEGRVRVTDFGLAREIVAERTDDPSELDDPRLSPVTSIGLTAPGAIVGTLPYLAPERLVGGPADESSDQFAYCVSLWEALFGERPFAGHTMIELAFAMSAGRPRPPSTAPRIPAWLLDAIARGLDHDPAHRWPNMDALLDALAHDPARRRRRWLQGAAVVGVAAIGIAGLRAWAGARAERCSEAAATAHLEGAWDDQRRGEVRDAVLGAGVSYAEGVWTRTQHVLDDYAAAWSKMHVEACEATTVRGEQSETVMDLRMGCLRRARVDLAAVTRVLARADPKTVQHADDVVASLRPLARCADVDALQADVEPPLVEDADAVDALRADLALARAEILAGRYEDARDALENAETALAGVAYAPVQSEVALVRGQVLQHAGDYAGAHAAFREALRLASASRQPGEMQTAASELLYVVGYSLQRFDEGLRYADVARAMTDGDPLREADVSNNVAIVLEAQGKHVEAEAELRRALALREEVLGDDDLAVAGTLDHLASMLTAQRRFAEAEATHRTALALQEQILGTEHPRVATTRNNLATDLQGQGKLAEAEAERRRVLALREMLLGPDHPDLAQSHNNLATVLYEQRKLVEAEAEFRIGLALRERALGKDHPRVAESHLNLGGVLNAQGRQSEAEAELRLGLAQQQAQLGEHPSVALAHHNLASVLRAQHEYTEAEAEYRKALALEEKLLGPEDPETAMSHHGLANTLEGLGELEEAEAEHRRALAIWETSLGHDHPYIGMCHVNLARVLLARGEIGEARRFAEAAWMRFAKDDIDPAWRPEAAFVLARTCWASGERADKGRAIRLAEGALASYVAAGNGDSKDATDVRTWLTQHGHDE